MVTNATGNAKKVAQTNLATSDKSVVAPEKAAPKRGGRKKANQ